MRINKWRYLKDILKEREKPVKKISNEARKVLGYQRKAMIEFRMTNPNLSKAIDMGLIHQELDDFIHNGYPPELEIDILKHLDACAKELLKKHELEEIEEFEKIGGEYYLL